MMTDDAKVQELIKQGVSKKELIINPGRFEKCTLCLLTFNENIQPKLLNCGHFICTQCLIEEKRCFYPGCNNTSPIIKDFSFKEKEEMNENRMFGFRLTLRDSELEVYKVVKGLTTIRELIQEPKIQEYISCHKLHFIQVNLGNKTAFLERVINEKIIDLYKVFRLIAKEGFYNSLFITIRYIGS